MERNGQPSADRDTSNATPGLVGVSFLFAIALIAYGVRMYARIHPTFKLAAPDYIISAALVGAKCNRLMQIILTLITAMRINRVYQLAGSCTLWLRAF